MPYRQRASTIANVAGLLLLCASVGAAAAKPSALCPTLKAQVVRGAKVAIDVSRCDGPFDGGMSGPIAPFAAHGKVSIGRNGGGVQKVVYQHNGGAATRDAFHLEDNENGVVAVHITILPPKPVKR